MADSTVTVTMLDDERIRDIVREEIAEHERRRALGALAPVTAEQLKELQAQAARELLLQLANAKVSS